MGPAPVEPPAPRKTRDPLPMMTVDAAPTERALPPDPAQRPDVPARSEAPQPEARHQPASAETPRQIAEQIAPRLVQAGRAGFDIALHPEELGSVRLKLVSHDGGSVLIIQAERPETLDLMRRHIGALEHELRALGHDQLSLRFNSTSPQSQGTSPGWLTGGQSGAQGGTYSGGQPGNQSGNTPSTAPQPDPPLITPDPIAARSLVRDHLDLRL
ncbi:flagellar hook-length control protein FliK [Pararhodobacter zhoushanensis]|uniref:Flagellar hook-length control protein FliK n=1 Tax=Pararhodobacter zhoushanensis TaxID=2479545 RepID=A0ABT3GU72_9RHOB|nr:flagellar hook-length control protein FliK [Pararhodobacter zhoushanensis]MCW1931085.1 flagellar hook-length control protein FliK [Pararhodobacter zhoushanensis]